MNYMDIDDNRDRIIAALDTKDCPDSMFSHYLNIADLLCHLDFDGISAEYIRFNGTVEIQVENGSLEAELTVFNNDMNVLASVYLDGQFVTAVEMQLCDFIDRFNHIAVNKTL